MNSKLSITDDLKGEADIGEPYFIGRIVEIQFNEITETGSIRFPRFICFRDGRYIEDT